MSTTMTKPLTVEFDDATYQKIEEQARQRALTPSDLLQEFAVTCLETAEEYEKANERLVAELDRRSAQPSIEVDLKTWAREKVKSYANNA